MKNTLEAFADAVQEKFSSTISGQPEDQLRSPFERLLADAGQVVGRQVLATGEAQLTGNGGRPDFGVSVNRLLCGHVELKAPGKGADTSLYTGHDRRQWQRFTNLPNILYSDGREFALYRSGETMRRMQLERDPRSVGAAGISADNVRQFNALMRDFLAWEPVVPGSSAELARYLAPLCRILRDDVLDALQADVEAVAMAASDWRRYLFPNADDARFADSYAQTVTFSLLLARSDGSDTLMLDDAIQSLTHASSLLSRALKVLTDPLIKEHLGTSLGLLQRVINAVPPGTMSGGRRDPWLHFYEDFLAEYDPALRKNAGAYYTPVEVVQAQVRMIDQLLRNKMGKSMGLASGGVKALDPAVGTGTYLLGIVEHALDQVARQEGDGAVPARADLLGENLYGFEYMVGPYAVAALRLTRMLRDRGGELPGDGVQIMLTNTLDSPYEKIPELPLMYRPIGVEHQRARRVKDTVPVLVCLGNPPYDRHDAVTDDNRAMAGGWVRWGETRDGRDAILQDFIEPVRRAGRGGDLKNLYNLYVYFWRWALWKTFEHELARGPGIVSYITASSFIDGDAFLGMRRLMRELCDEVWVIDLGGEGRGTRRDDNVFAIQTPVAITVAVRYGEGRPEQPARSWYTRIEGRRAAKLALLEQLESLQDLDFEACPDDWEAPLRPAGQGDFFDWPLLTDLMPWQTSGAQIKRTWPLAGDKDVLEQRWSALLESPDRAVALKETRDRKIDKAVSALSSTARLATIADLPSNAPTPSIRRYGYRSFDRHYLLVDNRLADYIRPVLWEIHSSNQLYFASLFTQPLSNGPALTASAEVPDLHYFRGSFGAKDIFPLWRDAKASLPNLHPELLPLLTQTLRRKVAAEDVAAYFYAVLAQPAFTERFEDELSRRELRLPLSAEPDLFEQGVELGRRLLFLHSFGERFSDGQRWPDPVVKCLAAVPGGGLPETFDYDSEKRIINVGGGRFGPVAPQVWSYEVSGLKVVQSWLGYRMKNRRGRKSSPLDDIRPAGWTGEYTSEFLRLLNLLDETLKIHPRQAALLEEIIAGPLLEADRFGPVPDAHRKPPRAGSAQTNIGV